MSRRKTNLEEWADRKKTPDASPRVF